MARSWRLVKPLASTGEHRPEAASHGEGRREIRKSAYRKGAVDVGGRQVAGYSAQKMRIESEKVAGYTVEKVRG